MTRITIVSKKAEEVEQSTEPAALKYFYGVEGSFDWIRSKLDHALMNSKGDYFGPYDLLWVKDIFYDTVIVENEDEGSYHEAIWEIDGNGQVTFGTFTEVAQEYVKKSREEAVKVKGGKVEARFVKKDKAKQIAYGYAMIPGEPDSDGDIVDEDKIETVAHKFIKIGYHDLMHEVGDPAAELVESWIEQEDKVVKFLNSDEEMVVPKGSWGIGVKVHDDVWPGVESGAYKGFSIMAVLQDDLAAAKSATDVEAAMKRVTLKDLEREGDWGVSAVSIVDDPAVGKALFFATKMKEPEEKPGLVSRLFGKKYAPSQLRYPKDHPEGGHFCDPDTPGCGVSGADSKKDPEAKTSDTKSYTIKEGDTLSEIAEQFGTTVEELLKLNPDIDDPDVIIAGEKLKVPDGEGSSESKEGEESEEGGDEPTSAGLKTLKANLKQSGLSDYYDSMKKALEVMMSDDPDWLNDFFADVPKDKFGEARMSVAAALEEMGYTVEYEKFEDGSAAPTGHPKRPKSLKNKQNNKNLIFISTMTNKSQGSEVATMAGTKGTEENASFELSDLVEAFKSATKSANEELLQAAGVIEAPKTEAEKQAAAMAAAVKGALGDSMKEFGDRLNKMEKAMSNPDKGDEDDSADDESAKKSAEAEDEAEEDDELVTLRKSMKRMQKQLAAMKKGSSKSLLSSDDEEDDDVGDDDYAFDGRDANGIRTAPLKEVS